MPATYLLRKHLATINSAGKPEAVAERRLYQLASERANRRKQWTMTPSF